MMFCCTELHIFPIISHWLKTKSLNFEDKIQLLVYSCRFLEIQKMDSIVNLERNDSKRWIL